MFDAEIESFKRDIDLRAYAAAQGYRLDARASWKGSAVMRDAHGDKIIIKRHATNGHYVYFSVRRDHDSGTIIDFIQHRQHLSLGAVRKELRPWIGQPPVPVPTFPALHKTTKDRLHVETEYARMHVALRHSYLEGERCLPAEVFGTLRFHGRIRQDARGNAIFPHFDADGVCGYEIRNSGFKGFAAGGTKGLWLSNEIENDDRLVICEGAIDALSHALLFLYDRARYASIGGKLNPQQPGLIEAAIARMRAGSEIVAAMDADAEGAKLALVVRQAFERTCRDDLGFVVQEPVGYKDFNDQLRGKQASFLPMARPSALNAG
jgi:hypothetical protein